MPISLRVSYFQQQRSKNKPQPSIVFSLSNNNLTIKQLKSTMLLLKEIPTRNFHDTRHFTTLFRTTSKINNIPYKQMEWHWAWKLLEFHSPQYYQSLASTHARYWYVPPLKHYYPFQFLWIWRIAIMVELFFLFYSYILKWIKND